MCLRSKDRSGGQRALRQQKAGERKAPQRSLLDTKNLPQLRPARELRGVIEHCGHQLGQERLLHKLSIFCGAPPPLRKHCLRREALSHLSPAQRKKIFDGWSGGSFQAEEGGEERVWEVCKWPGRSYLQCLGPLGLPVGMLALVAVLSCNVTAAGLLRPSTCTRLQLPSPCRPLLLPSPLRPPGTRARAYPRRLYEPWL